MAGTVPFQGLDEGVLMSIEAQDEASIWCDPLLLLPFPVGFYALALVPSLTSLKSVDRTSSPSDQILPVSNDNDVPEKEFQPKSGKSKRKKEAPSLCEICGKRFTRAFNLRSHMKAHSGERPYSCHICGKLFRRQYDRRRHQSIHTGEGKFVCDGKRGCGRRFARSDAFFRHLKSAAGSDCCQSRRQLDVATSPLQHDDNANYDLDNESSKTFDTVSMSLTDEDWSLSNIYGGLDAKSTEGDTSASTSMPGQKYAAWWDSYTSVMKGSGGKASQHHALVTKHNSMSS